MPTARYQHSAVFVGARLHISGGAVGGGKMVEEHAVVVLDTGAGVWCTTKSPGDQAERAETTRSALHESIIGACSLFSSVL